MYFKEGKGQEISGVSLTFKGTLVLLAAVVILLGIFPGLLLNWYYF